MKSDKKTYAENKISKIDLNKNFIDQFEMLVGLLKKELYKISEVNAVVLFGSFARGDYSVKHSDLDIMIFVDKDKKDSKLEERILKKVIKLNLGKEISIHTIFQYKRIDEEDKTLMLTIANQGQVLFSKQSLIISKNILGLKNHFLIKFDVSKTEPVVKNKLQRFLHGYIMKGKRYKGIVDEEKVLSAGKGAIIVPEDLLKKILIFCQNIGVKAVQKARFYR